MIYANGVRDFEFIYENNGTPRNEGAGQARRHPRRARRMTYWVKLISDGSNAARRVLVRRRRLRPRRPRRGHLRLVGPAGRPGRAVRPSDRRTRSRASTGSASTRIRRGGGGGGGGGAETELFADEFDGTDVGAGWDGRAPRPGADGVGRRAAHPGRGRRPLCRRRRPPRTSSCGIAPASGPWTATAKVNFEGLTQYQQAGIVVYGDDDDYLKLGRIAHTTARVTRSSSSSTRTAGTPRNDAADSTAEHRGGLPGRLLGAATSDGTNVTGWYSTDGSTGPRSDARRRCRRTRGSASSPSATRRRPRRRRRRSTRSASRGPGAPSGPSFDDEFDGSTLDADALGRQHPAEPERGRAAVAS